MELTKTAKIQIFPNESEKELLLDSMKAYVNACNFVSSHIYASKDLSQASVHKSVYEPLRSHYLPKLAVKPLALAMGI